MRPKPCVRWYRKAAEQGDSKGQNGLGRCYEHGLGVPKDLAAAAQWYRIAAGDARQRNGEARGLHAAFGQAFPDADAQYNIGRCFAYGLGVKRDFAEAMRWFRASSVHPYAHYELGRCYEEGRGVSKDLDRAAEWYRKSAKSCATWDQYSNYGAMVEKDIQQRLHRIAEIKVEGDANVANAAAGKSGDESSTTNSPFDKSQWHQKFLRFDPTANKTALDNALGRKPEVPPKPAPPSPPVPNPAPDRLLLGPGPNPLLPAPSPTPVTLSNPVYTSKFLVNASEIQIDESRPPLGEGGFGIVYVGTLHRSTRVAIKKIKGFVDEKVLKLFVREVDTWEGLVQKNILPLMAYSLYPPMLVSDLMKDGNMRQYLSRLGWPLKLSLKLLLDVATGMAYLHSKHIVHGDLKSANIMVDEQRALIADFGLSRFRAELATSGFASSGSSIMGTPGFIAPEMLAGSSARSPADVYAFAMVCYEVLSKGRSPFDDLPNVAAMLYKVAVERARPARPNGVPDAVWKMVERCWAHEPEDRPDFVTTRDVFLGPIVGFS